ncbi:MAG TPA: tyrosine-type recombinase/integrase [Spirochaetota bacterium]|nr:tyrosine-type recombinase/integrase [Spirochaetota bacterium]HNT12732.1 tyrosine-type recombinase/integrase [Spirochaetota bacterium]
MSSKGKPFYLYRRNRVYYCRFKLPDGRINPGKSTGETAKGRAEQWAIEYLRSGQIVRRENITLSEFAKDFFIWSGSWATDKRVRGLRIGQRQCRNLTYLLNDFILPRFGSIKLTSIDKIAIRRFRNDLFDDGYAGNTINKILSALKIILESAEDQSLIQHVPKIERAALNPKRKGILTIEEVKKLFSIQWKSKAVHCHPSRDLFMGFVGNLLACSTGLRMGEIQALVLSDVHLEGGYIHVRRSWDRLIGLNDTTKTGRARNIFIPCVVKDSLSQLIEINPDPGNPDSFIFFSMSKPDKPAESKVFIRALYTALGSIGITDQERRERNITFHSWRHWFNSLLINAKVPIQKIQSLTGHMTAEMTQHYYHIDDMDDVVSTIQQALIPVLPENFNKSVN